MRGPRQRPGDGPGARPPSLRGTWVAHGSGDADREVVDDQDKVRVPPMTLSTS